MMKIETQETAGQVVLKVEGRLAGACVGELEKCWRAAREHDPATEVAVDLNSVTCIDQCGRRLLEAMSQNGVRFTRARLAIEDIVRQVEARVDCRGHVLGRN